MKRQARQQPRRHGIRAGQRTIVPLARPREERLVRSGSLIEIPLRFVGEILKDALRHPQGGPQIFVIAGRLVEVQQAIPHECVVFQVP